MFGKLIGRFLFVLGLVALALPVYATSGTYNFELKSGHLSIDGNSTLHKYKIETTSFSVQTGALSLSSPTISDMNAFLSQLAGNFTVKIPVQSLKDPEPGFNGNLYRNLKYKQHPNIIFTLTSATATPNPKETGSYNVTAQGNLTIAGVQKQETITAVFDVDGSNIHITGKKDLLMSDFGIKPPTMFFGTVRTDDQVTVPWDLSLSLK